MRLVYKKLRKKTNIFENAPHLFKDRAADPSPSRMNDLQVAEAHGWCILLRNHETVLLRLSFPAKLKHRKRQHCK